MDNSIPRSVLLSSALGDAWAAPTGFLTVPEIEKRWPPVGPTAPSWKPLLVTDDTQMAIYCAFGIRDAWPSLKPEDLAASISKQFVKWLHDPKNDRAPGNTCLRACEGLDEGMHWTRASMIGSKGCGANMRVHPVALLHYKGVDRETILGLAQLQAALTHGHPTGLAAAELTALTVCELLNGTDTHRLLDALLAHARKQFGHYREDWLGDLWLRSGERSPEAFIDRGWEENIEVLERVRELLPVSGNFPDPCSIGGQGWIAEEALATALLCFLESPEHPMIALHRAAVTSGDSDSIAAICGAFLGAAGATEDLEPWFEALEYRSELEELADWFGKP